jgi:hypothetical protein
MKPIPMHMMNADGDEIAETKYNQTRTTYLILYLVINILSQCTINANAIITMCGGSSTRNVAVGFLVTTVPWLFFFGGVMICLILFPAWKSSFSNVVGYFAVAKKTNKILNTLFVNPDIEAELEKGNLTSEEKQGLQRAAASIIKLTSNPSIFINQILPENFAAFWNITLLPLMKREYLTEKRGELENMKEQLFHLVVTRDNTGESFWYIYTAILLIFIVSYKISKRGCKKDPSTLTSDIQGYQEETQQTQDQEEKLNSTTYIG